MVLYLMLSNWFNWPKKPRTPNNIKISCKKNCRNTTVVISSTFCVLLKIGFHSSSRRYKITIDKWLIKLTKYHTSLNGQSKFPTRQWQTRQVRLRREDAKNSGLSGYRGIQIPGASMNWIKMDTTWMLEQIVIVCFYRETAGRKYCRMFTSPQWLTAKKFCALPCIEIAKFMYDIHKQHFCSM